MKSFLGNFYRHLAIFFGLTGRQRAHLLLESCWSQLPFCKSVKIVDEKYENKWKKSSVMTHLKFYVLLPLSRGGGQVVSTLAFYSNDPSLNPAEVYCLKSVKLFENNKNKSNKWLRMTHYIF